MSAPAAHPRRRLRPRTIAWIVLGLALFAAANTHLVYVSFQSQPDCVPHLKAGQSGDGYRAARSSC